MGKWRLPPERDFGFYQRRKHDAWRPIPGPDPALEAPVADSHTHVHSLPDPAWELARCAANGVDLLCDIADPSDDAMDRVFSLTEMDSAVAALLAENSEMLAGSATPDTSDTSTAPTPPTVRLALGVHPHNAEVYDDQLESQLKEYLSHPAVRVLGEIGLDYYYDNSPREVQRDVFRRQLRLAKELGMPVALHLRSGADPENDNAHREALAILQEDGLPEAGTLLHCCALAPEELQPWIDEGCYVAYGGALTFKDAERAREGATLVPMDRLLLETDAPYMTPEPLRGATCTPAHVIFTAERLAELRGGAPGPERQEFLQRIHDNTERFLGDL